MAILFTDGFDSYGTTTGTNILTRWTTVSTPSYISSSVTPYNYGQSFYIGASTNIAVASIPATATFTFGCAVYLTSISASPGASTYALLEVLNSGTSQLFIHFLSGGFIQVSRAPNTVLATSAVPGKIKANAWYYIEFSATISDTVGTIRVDVDGETVINATGLDTRNGTPTNINQIRVGSNGDSNEKYFDDLYVSDSITPLGPQRIYALKPNADTAEKDWVATAGWQPFSGTTASGSAFATKSNIFTALQNGSLTGVSVYCGATAQTIKLGVAQLTSITGTVSSVLYESSTVARSATAGYQSFTFPAVNFTAGNVYAIYVTRTDGIGTSVLAIGSSNVQDMNDPTGLLLYNAYGATADNNITGGETLYTGTAAGWTMYLNYGGLDNYISVFDVDTDADISYVTASNVGDYDLYDVASYPPANANIKAVNQIVWAKKTDATARTMTLTTKSGATTTDSTAVTLSTNYVGYSRVYETDPNTASAWTVSGVNALQIGQKVAS